MSRSITGRACGLSMLALATGQACDEPAIEYRTEVLVGHVSDASMGRPAADEEDDAATAADPDVDADRDAGLDGAAMTPSSTETDARVDSDSGSNPAPDSAEPDAGEEQPRDAGGDTE